MCMSNKDQTVKVERVVLLQTLSLFSIFFQSLTDGLGSLGMIIYLLGIKCNIDLIIVPVVLRSIWEISTDVETSHAYG